MQAALTSIAPAPVGAERGGDPRRGAGHQLVVAGRRDEDQVELGGGDAGGGERPLAGGGGELEEPLAGRGDAALVDPGALHDPALVDPEPGGDRRVGDDGLGHGDAEAGDLGAGARRPRGVAGGGRRASGGGRRAQASTARLRLGQRARLGARRGCGGRGR